MSQHTSTHKPKPHGLELSWLEAATLHLPVPPLTHVLHICPPHMSAHESKHMSKSMDQVCCPQRLEPRWLEAATLHQPLLRLPGSVMHSKYSATKAIMERFGWYGGQN